MAVLQSRRTFVLAAVLALAALAMVIAGTVTHRPSSVIRANMPTEGSIVVSSNNGATEGS
jgi:hypothetical protein